MTIYFDMDGTIADLYGVPGWLQKLTANDPSPYAQAKPLVNMSLLARRIHQLEKQNVKFGIISWLSKGSNPAYDQAVTQAKLKWLKTHLPSVTFAEIHILPYGTPKSSVVDKAFFNILFDDEDDNRKEWLHNFRCFAYHESAIFGVMKNMLI